MTRLVYVQGVPIWRNVVALRWALQIVSAVVVLSAIALLLLNVAREIEARDLPFGFTFLDRAAQIPIGEAIIPYQPSDSYLHGLVVAGLNTIRASILGVILATVIGILVGVARLSPNWLLNRLALAYIEVFRNIPLIVQLLFWLAIVLTLPKVSEGFVIADTFYLNTAASTCPGFRRRTDSGPGRSSAWSAWGWPQSPTDACAVAKSKRAARVIRCSRALALSSVSA